jgi:hypothetical protein
MYQLTEHECSQPPTSGWNTHTQNTFAAETNTRDYVPQLVAEQQQAEHSNAHAYTAHEMNRLKHNVHSLLTRVFRE